MKLSLKHALYILLGELLINVCRTVGAIKLADYNQNSDHFTGQTATISGWGTTSSGGALATILQFAEVLIWSDERKFILIDSIIPNENIAMNILI